MDTNMEIWKDKKTGKYLFLDFFDYNPKITRTPVITYSCTEEDFKERYSNVQSETKKDNRWKFFIFSLRWRFKNRKWIKSRQKNKRMMEDYYRYQQGVLCRYI